MKPCTKCTQTKELGDFYKDSRARDGLTSWCRSCDKARRTAWRKLNLEKARAASRVRYNANLDKERAATRAWREANPDKARTAVRAWHKANPGKAHAKNVKRRSQKLKATPPWLSKSQLLEIQSIYMSCPKGHHVDHIIPLQGKNVKGLHVPWNLQYLLASDNLSKGNKF